MTNQAEQRPTDQRPTDQRPKDKIHLLDQLTANQIAAGEVAERPAAVVKELVENAIDAGASRIEVRVFDQSCQRLQVTDNGCGMSPADMRLAVLRHATSKLNSAADLDSLTTLGFRGEALPSIAAVSQMSITSKQADSQVGYTMRVEEGKAGVPEETAAQNGTIVRVERLFYNAPARRKFMKSPRTELGLISDVVERLAISHPDIAFQLRHGNQRLVVTSGSGDLAQTVQAVYSRELAENMLHLRSEGEPRVSGLISFPAYNRSSRHYFFFVNGRTVQSRELVTAVENGYYTSVPPRRYPIVFIFLELPPGQVDVNVHPGKLEVKFSDPRAVKEAVAEAVRQALYHSERLVPKLGLIQAEPFRSTALPTVPKIDESVIRQANARPQPLLGVRESRNMSSSELYKALYKGAYTSVVPPRGPAPDEAELARLTEAYLRDANASAAAAQDQRLSFASLQVIGQYRGSYILAANEDGLYIIDQHAAAERVLYEQIVHQAASSPVHVEQLAVPIRVQLTNQEHLLVSEHILELRDFGFILEYFGDTSYIIRGVPFWYADDQAEQLLLALLDSFAQEEGELHPRAEELFMAACKRAVKANRYLSSQDISGLLAALDRCENPVSCPHGRPIMILLTEAEIRKRFLRSSI